MTVSEIWPSLLRVTVALYWLYFASQKWNGVDWMRGVIKATADANPIPGLHQLLENVIAPNWFVFGVLQGAGETAVGILLLLGIGTRWAAILGVLLAANLAFTVAFAVDTKARPDVVVDVSFSNCMGSQSAVTDADGASVGPDLVGQQLYDALAKIV